MDFVSILLTTPVQLPWSPKYSTKKPEQVLLQVSYHGRRSIELVTCKLDPPLALQGLSPAMSTTTCDLGHSSVGYKCCS